MNGGRSTGGGRGPKTEERDGSSSSSYERRQTPRKSPKKEDFSIQEYPELNELVKRHDQLISLILQEEEELIASHRQHIDNMVDLVKEEMVYINHVDRPGSDVDAYVAGLDHILNLKTQYVDEIRKKVNRFQDHLREEDALSKKFQERKISLQAGGTASK